MHPNKNLSWTLIDKARGIFVSTNAVSATDFFAFVEATGHVPHSDIERGDGYAFRYLKLNMGSSRDTPMYGVSFKDAEAFAEHIEARLPTVDELTQFFSLMASQGHKFKWHGYCWTTTPCSEGYLVTEGPYSSKDGLVQSARRVACLPSTHTKLLEFPTFRVLRVKE